MSQRMSQEYLQREYDELMQRAKAISEHCNCFIEYYNDSQKEKEESQNKKYRTILITTTCIALLFCVAVFLFFDSFVFVYETKYTDRELTNGKDVVCYITVYGDCYHKSSCGFLHSKIQTTMYEAEKDGYKPCEYCWDYPQPIYSNSTKTKITHQYIWSISISLLSIGIPYVLLIILLSKKYKKKIDAIRKEYKDQRIELCKNSLKSLNNGLNFLMEAEIYSCVPGDVEYKEGFPQTEDHRYIVYKSSDGTVYHSKKTCRGKELFPVHSFLASKYLQPCYYCAKAIEIPEWHKKYIELYNCYMSVKKALDNETKT